MTSCGDSFARNATSPCPMSPGPSHWFSEANASPGLTLFPISQTGIPLLLSERFRRSKRSRFPSAAAAGQQPPSENGAVGAASASTVVGGGVGGTTGNGSNAGDPIKSLHRVDALTGSKNAKGTNLRITDDASSSKELTSKTAIAALATRPSDASVVTRRVLQRRRLQGPGAGNGAGNGVGGGVLGMGGLSTMDDMNGTGLTAARADSPTTINDIISPLANNSIGINGASGGSATVGPGAGRRGGGIGKEKVQQEGDDKEKEIGLPPLDPEESYKPFPLAVKSSFNPSKISERQRKTMDKLTRAKYGAYDKPDASVSQNIDNSRARAKQWSKENHRMLRIQIDDIRRTWKRRKGFLDEDEERQGQEAAKKAMERMRGKLKSILMSRENELQFLVEGQKNAIDAIRLKEFLVSRPPDVKLGRQYSDKDRLRVEELLL